MRLAHRVYVYTLKLYDLQTMHSLFSKISGVHMVRAKHCHAALLRCRCLCVCACLCMTITHKLFLSFIHTHIQHDYSNRSMNSTNICDRAYYVLVFYRMCCKCMHCVVSSCIQLLSSCTLILTVLRVSQCHFATRQSLESLQH